MIGFVDDNDGGAALRPLPELETLEPNASTKSERGLAMSDAENSASPHTLVMDSKRVEQLSDAEDDTKTKLSFTKSRENGYSNDEEEEESLRRSTNDAEEEEEEEEIPRSRRTRKPVEDEEEEELEAPRPYLTRKHVEEDNVEKLENSHDTISAVVTSSKQEVEGEIKENDEPAKENGLIEFNEDSTELKKKKKKKPTENGERRKKKKKKGEFEMESKRAVYMNRDDILEKHVGPRVRSFDAAKMKSKFEKPQKASTQVSNDCRICGKQVFQMEKIVAEKSSWHKDCFRCTECNSKLTLETYQSHEGAVYCKPHFKSLFQPKAVIEDEMEQRKDRSSDKPDYGLEELQNANVRQKFAMFESANKHEEERKLESVSVRRSQSLMSKAAKFLNSEEDGLIGVESSELGEYDEDEEEDNEEEEEEEDDENTDPDAVKVPKKSKKGRPMSFNGMGDLKASWQQKKRREEMSAQRKEEVARFRQMLCAGKNITLKEKFELGEFDDERHVTREQVKFEGMSATSLKEKFEKGFEDDNEKNHSGERNEVEEIFKDAETASKARSLFKAIDAGQDIGSPNMRNHSSHAPREHRLSQDGCEETDEVFGRDPNLIKSTDNYQDEIDCRSTRNTLEMFKKMEKKAIDGDDEDEDGPRPLKRFTPPPEGEENDDESESYSSEYSDDDEEEDEGEEKIPKYQDEVLQMAKKPSQSARKAASLRAKFEKWEEQQNEKNRSTEGGDEECMPSIDTARNLRAMFENKAQEASMPTVKTPIKVNRFVGGGGDQCVQCGKTVYAMERLEVHSRILHKNCFKCSKCKTQLSMGSFSVGGEKMYCTTHYKQLFTEKGNYEAFTPNSKGKWTKKIEATSPEGTKNQE